MAQTPDAERSSVRESLSEYGQLALLLGFTLLCIAAPFVCFAAGTIWEAVHNSIRIVGPVLGLLGSIAAGFIWSKNVPMSCFDGGSILTSMLSVLVMGCSSMSGVAFLILGVLAALLPGFGR